MTTPDPHAQTEQPHTAQRHRTELLFGGGSVVGLRAASTTIIGTSRKVSVWLYGDPPAGLVAPGLWSLKGTPLVIVTGPGTIVAAGTDPQGHPIPAHIDLPIATAQPGLPSRAPYRLGINPAALAGLGLELDPLRRHLPVRLRPECKDAPDCLTIPDMPGPLTPPDYDTLARDYAGLRAMLLERLAALRPNSDMSPADLTVTLVELMAHLGDLLNYRLDRVATETWLPTARRRAVVTRHARLVDYPVPPAISAETMVQVHCPRTEAGGDDSFSVMPGDTATDAPGDPHDAPDSAYFALDLTRPARVYASQGEVALYDWCEGDAVLTAGATSAILVLPRPADGIPLAQWLPVGARMAFEVVSPGDPGVQQSWARRGVDWPPDDGGGGPTRAPLASHPAQVVTVKHVAPFTDPLAPGLPLVRVTWDAPLQRAVPVSVDLRAGSPRVGVARLGVFPAHHGLIVDGSDAIETLDPLTGTHPDPALVAVTDYFLTAAGARGLSCAPGGRPWQLDTRVMLPSGVTVAATRVTSLLRATAEGFAVVVDQDDDYPPRLRFRTGNLGVVPPAQSTVTVRYQVGAGPEGMIASNTLTRLIRTASPPGQRCEWAQAGDGVTARNLTPAIGGQPAMPLDDVRRDAPQAFAAVARRAVLISDLPQFATAVPGVVRAASRPSWSGSWPVGLVTVEASGSAAVADVAGVMSAVRMAGTEVIVRPARPIGLLFAVTVCLTPGTEQAIARMRILAALRPGRPDAVFAPAAHPLGTSVYTSQIVAAVAGVPGVDAVRITQARRLSDPVGTLEEVLVMGPEELAVCDDDMHAPDRGRIELTIEGGR